MDEIELLQKLIQIPSFSGHEEKLAEFILDYCKHSNLPAKFQKGNVIIHLKGKNQSKALIFNAHMDTVGVSNRKLWEYPPTGEDAGKFIDGKIYGLGASDDKGAIGAMLLVAESTRTPPCDLWFTFVCCEETDGSGTAHFLNWFVKSKYYKRYKKIAAIIGEPTGLSTLEIGHRGNVFIKLETSGVSGHGAKNYKVSHLAVEKMLKALVRLRKAFNYWKKQYHHHFLGEPTMNVVALQTSSTSQNQLPSSCMTNLDIRTTPKLHGEIMTLFKNTLGKEVKIGLSDVSRPPGLTSERSPIVAVFQKVLPQLSLGIAIGSTDICQFNKNGIDTVVFGPGEKETLHSENEYIEISKLKECVKLYKKIAEIFAL